MHNQGMLHFIRINIPNNRNVGQMDIFFTTFTL